MKKTALNDWKPYLIPGIIEADVFKIVEFVSFHWNKKKIPDFSYCTNSFYENICSCQVLPSTLLCSTLLLLIKM